MGLVEDASVEVVVDLAEEAFEGGKATAQGTGLELEVDFGGGEGAGLGFENVAGEVLFVFNVEGDDATLARDGTAGLDLVGLVWKGQWG